MNTVIKTNKAPAAFGPYVQGIKSGNLIFTSGQIPVDPKTGNIPEKIEHQTRQALQNIKGVVEEAGCNMSQVIKMTIYLTDMNDYDTFNDNFKSFFDNLSSNYPARTCVEVSRLPKNVKIEIDAVLSTN